MSTVVDRARAVIRTPALTPDTARSLLPEMVAEIERLSAGEWAARGERDSMRRRLALLTADESWWVGGVWGDYGEAVLPVRAVHMVLGEQMTGQRTVGEPELNPALAATWRDLRATVERFQAAIAEIDALHSATRDITDEYVCCGCAAYSPCPTVEVLAKHGLVES